MKQDSDNDWRLTNQDDYLKGVRLKWMAFAPRPGKEEWDHEHCEFCRQKIVPQKNLADWDDSVIGEAYATEDGYRWICPKCFADFKGRFAWQVVDKEQEIEPVDGEGRS